MVEVERSGRHFVGVSVIYGVACDVCIPGFRLRTPHSVDTAFFKAGSAEIAKPAATVFLPTLWAARCVPFTIAADRDATVFSFML